MAESSVASGVRRIEALTGFGTYLRLEEDEDLLRDISQTLRAPRGEITRAITRLIENQRELEGELETIKRKTALRRSSNWPSRLRNTWGRELAMERSTKLTNAFRP